MFMAHEPQIPSLQDLLKVRVGSTSFLILINASRTCDEGLSDGRLFAAERGGYHGPTLVQVDCVRLEFGGSRWFIWVLFSRVRVEGLLEE